MFFILPVAVDYRARRYPVVTFTLMGINTLIYLVSLVAFMTNGQSDEWIVEKFWLNPSESVGYTYLTSLFVHDGFFHLLGNMIYLFLFGACVEDLMGRDRFIVFYLLGGLAADFSHIAATPGHFASDIPLGGASGAVSACICGFLVLQHRANIEFRWLIWIIIRLFTGVFWLPAWLVISFWFLKDLLFAFASATNEEFGGGVAFAAHVGGGLAGMAMIGAYKAFLKLRPAAPDTAEALIEEPVAVSQELPAIYLYDAGAQSGPLTSGHIAQMLELGAISADTLYWRDGMPEWRPVSELRPPPL